MCSSDLLPVGAVVRAHHSLHAAFPHAHLKCPVYAGAVNRRADAAALLRHGVSGLLGEDATPLSDAVADYRGSATA